MCWFNCVQLVNKRFEVTRSLFHWQQWIYQHEDIGRSRWLQAGCTRRHYWWQHWATTAWLWRYYSHTSTSHHAVICPNHTLETCVFGIYRPHMALCTHSVVCNAWSVLHDQCFVWSVLICSSLASFFICWFNCTFQFSFIQQVIICWKFAYNDVC